MGRNQADTIQCSLLINIQQLIRACALAGQLLVASFFISCIKRLWDVVGHFLGSIIGLVKFIKINGLDGCGRCFRVAAPLIC
ncbi:hypothetical protein D3C86_1612040 [compost metagenome]